MVYERGGLSGVFYGFEVDSTESIWYTVFGTLEAVRLF